MRLATLALALLALAAVAAPQVRHPRTPAAPPQPSEEEDQKAIADLQRRDIDANIALDTDKLLAIRTDDIVYLVPGQPPIAGQDAVRKYLEGIQAQLSNWDMTAYEENWQEVRVLGDFAYEWGTITIRAKREGESRESAAVRNVMQVLRRQPDADWKIARVIWNVQSSEPLSAPTKPKQQVEPQKPKEPKN